MIGIYKITNKINGKVYIGQSKSIETRWRQHITDLVGNTHHCFRLQNDFNKYGIEKFIFEVLEICEDEDKLTTLEQYYMDFNYENLYNSKRAESNIRGLGNRRQIFKPQYNDLIFNSINSQRLFLLILDKAIRCNERYIEVGVKEFTTMLNMQGNSIYERFEGFSKDLANLKINGESIFEYCVYDKHALCCNINNKVWEAIKFLSVELFKDLKLTDLLNLKSTKTLSIIFHVRLEGTFNVTLTKIKEMFNVNKNYKVYSEFKRNVIKPIKNDMEYLGFKLDIVEYRKGRNITDLSFSFI